MMFEKNLMSFESVGVDAKTRAIDRLLLVAASS